MILYFDCYYDFDVDNGNYYGRSDENNCYEYVIINFVDCSYFGVSYCKIENVVYDSSVD